MATAKVALPRGFDYTVIKHNELNGNVSFIHCPNFDTADEPSTGDYAVVRSDGTVKLHAALADPYIYHHKWLFVAKDYQGFDVSKSQERSVAWMSLDDVDKSLIGRASYWNREVVPRLLKSPDEGWLRSEETRKRLKLTTCDLAHMREAGEPPESGRVKSFATDFHNLQVARRRAASRATSGEGCWTSESVPTDEYLNRRKRRKQRFSAEGWQKNGWQKDDARSRASSSSCHPTSCHTP